MDAKQILKESEKQKEQLIRDRRYLHSHAETGFDLIHTKEYVKQKLTEMGYSPRECGRCGLIATHGSISGAVHHSVYAVRFYV